MAINNLNELNNLKDLVSKSAVQNKLNEILESAEDTTEAAQLQGKAAGPGACYEIYYMELCDSTVETKSNCWGSDYCTLTHKHYTQPGGCEVTSITKEDIYHDLSRVGGRDHFDELESRYKKFLLWEGRFKPVDGWDNDN